MFTIGASSQYKMHSISEVSVPLKNYIIIYSIIHTNRRASSVGLSLIVRENALLYRIIILNV